MMGEGGHWGEMVSCPLTCFPNLANSDGSFFTNCSREAIAEGEMTPAERWLGVIGSSRGRGGTRWAESLGGVSASGTSCLT